MAPVHDPLRWRSHTVQRAVLQQRALTTSPIQANTAFDSCLPHDRKACILPLSSQWHMVSVSPRLSNGIKLCYLACSKSMLQVTVGTVLPRHAHGSCSVSQRTNPGSSHDFQTRRIEGRTLRAQRTAGEGPPCARHWPFGREKLPFLPLILRGLSLGRSVDVSAVFFPYSSIQYSNVLAQCLIPSVRIRASA